MSASDRPALLENVRLSAVNAVLPAGEIIFEEEALAHGLSQDEARRAAALSGLERRRIAPPGVTALDLCLAAAAGLLETVKADAGGAASPPIKVDALFFVSQSPDYLLPASASIIQGRLNLPDSCLCMDMNSGCAGYVMGLLACASLIACGAAERTLLLVGDTQGRFLNPANRVTAPLFGDAGTATLLEKAPGESMNFHWGGDGAKYEHLIIPGGGARLPQCPEEGPEAPFNAVVADERGNPWTLGDYGQLWMDGVGVFSFGVSVVPAHIKEHLALAGLAPEDLDSLVLHQANRLMLETIAQKCRVPLSRTPMKTLARYGNLGAASIPTLLCDEFGRHGGASRPEDKAPPAKAMFCGFGAGLSWASCVLSLKKTLFMPPSTLKETDYGNDRATSIQNWHRRFADA